MKNSTVIRITFIFIIFEAKNDSLTQILFYL